MNAFTEISIIIVIATAIAGLMRLLKQPLIMGHIITGLLVGPRLLGIVDHSETLEAFSRIGIAILLFIVGLGLRPKVIKEVGKISLVTGMGQVLFTSLIGYFIARLFGYSNVHSIYIAIALTFSSTIIILKLLSDKKDLEKLYAKIAIGFLLVQDIVATLILVIVSTLAGSDSAFTVILFTLLKGGLLAVLITLISAKVLPKISDFFAKSQEFLFLFSIGWGLGVAMSFQYIGYSIEIGALIAGVTLSVSPYSEEISSKLKPLRDFFIIMFFVLLGTELVLDNAGTLILQSLVFSIFVLVGNPLIVIALMGALGYKKRTGFFAGLTVAQISEFSLILVLLGMSVGQVDQNVLSLVTFVGLITIAGSTYLILYAEKIYPRIASYLSIFEKKKDLIETNDLLSSYEVILFGANRVGYDFIRLFKKMGQSFLAIDFNPEIVAALNEEGINTRYGDAEDSEFLETLALDEAKMVVSTIPEYEVNAFLISKALHTESENAPILIMISHDIDDALKLYEKGATYVILPHFIGGHFAALLAAEHWFSVDRFTAEKEKHIQYLQERKELGHKHPEHHSDR